MTSTNFTAHCVANNCPAPVTHTTPWGFHWPNVPGVGTQIPRGVTGHCAGHAPATATPVS